jgi:signal transduction histidine kinase
MGGTFLLLIACTQQVKRLRQKEETATRTLLIFRQQERDRLEEQVKARTQELKLAMEAAQAANQAKSGLLAHISHDLRAPLATIIAYARHPGESEAELHSSRKAIENNAYNQLQLIDELIDYSSCELGVIPLHVVPGSWSSFAEGLVSDAHQLARTHANQLIFNSPDTLPPVIHADFRRLRRILMNLLSNAAKYTQAGNIFFDVRRVRQPEQSGQITLEFVVTDSGIGMSEETLSQLFSPFARGDNALTQEGTGLGLIIARDLVRAMGGRLTIRSALGQGSRFSFMLNFRSEELAQDGSPLSSPTAPPRHLDGRITQPSILILDTAGSSLTATLHHLRNAGYRTLKAEHSTVALQLLDQHPVDLLIVADNIPADDGWDVLTAAHAHHPPIPSLLHASGAAARPDGRPASLCFDAELPQTAPPSQLLETVQALLDTGPFGRPLDKPDPGSLNTLREMVANGQVSDIELWVREQLHNAPQHRDFAMAVRQAAADLNFGLLEQYCK